MKAEDFDYLPTNYVDPKSLSEFIELNMPTYVQQLKENKVEARALYQKYKVSTSTLENVRASVFLQPK